MVVSSLVQSDTALCKAGHLESKVSELNLTPIKSSPRTTPRKGALNVLDEFKEKMKEGKPHLNLVVIGHVDAGKSTLMGHFLYELGQINEKTMMKYKRDADKLGKGSFAYAWILDETKEERSRGITMDIALTRFETPHKRITLLDAPGHKDFVPNMISGASQADVAILVVDATKGEFETGFNMGGQTKEHTLLAHGLGVSQVIVTINKMDCVDFSQERYDFIRSELDDFLKHIVGFKESRVFYIPCSGLLGENLTQCTSEPLKQWYQGPTLLHQIGNIYHYYPHLISMNNDFYCY
jgi:elongation factor 1 alpha-like protein